MSQQSRIQQIEFCRDMVSDIGLDAAANALAEASEDGLTVAGARSLLMMTPGEPRRQYLALESEARAALRRLTGY